MGGLTIGHSIEISVIMPVFNEEDTITAAVRSLEAVKGNHCIELIVVDGHQHGTTLQCITGSTFLFPVIPLKAPKGRGKQMNAGARQASGSILLFLHADTALPDNGFEKIKEVITSGQYVGGAFNYAVESRNPLIRHLYLTSYWRSRISRSTPRFSSVRTSSKLSFPAACTKRTSGCFRRTATVSSTTSLP